MRYTYNEFVVSKDLLAIVEKSIPVLENKGINPSLFYGALIEHPEILESEDPLNELWDWARKGWAGVKSGLSGLGAGRQARRTQGDIDTILKMSPQDQQAAGFDAATIQKMKQDQASQQAAAGKGFWGNVGAGWGQKGQELAGQAQQQRLAGIQQKYGVGPFGQQPTPQPQPPNPQPQPPTPQPQPQPNPSAFNHQAAAQQLQQVLKSLGKARRPGAVKVLQSVIAQLQAIP